MTVLEDKPKLLIVEGCTGSGKSTLTNNLREQMLSTSLIRLSGIKDKSLKGEIRSLLYHESVLKMLKGTYVSGMNWVMDRSFLSDYVYAKLRLKDYSFTYPFEVLTKQLDELSEYYDVHCCVLSVDKTCLEERLKRDKAAYETFSVESSIKQQKEYLNVLKDLPKSVNSFNINVSNLSLQEVTDIVLKELEK